MLRGAEMTPVRHPFASDPARAVFVEFLAAAMCHATNWDRLRFALLTAAADGERFSPIRLEGLSFGEFENEFQTAFGAVEDLPRRHMQFLEVASAFASNDEPIDGKRLAVEPQRLSGDGGLYGRLDRLGPFAEDPQKKKTRILVQQLHRYGLLTLVDPENIKPAVEYHLVRLYLRTGRVAHADYDERSDADLVGAPLRARDVRSISALRLAVEEAMHYTADAAELPMPDVNELEWQVARSYCDRVRPRCNGPAREDKPVHPEIDQLGAGGCLFRESCDGARDPNFATLVEPRLADHHAYY